MAKIKKAWDLISNQERTNLTEKIIYFFKNERDEDIGVIAAHELIDFFLENTANTIYNKGVEDSKQSLLNVLENASIDIDALLKR